MKFFVVESCFRFTGKFLTLLWPIYNNQQQLFTGVQKKKKTIFNTLKSMSNDPVLQLGSKPNFSKSLTIRSKTDISSRREKGESQNGCFKKTKQTKLSERQTFLTPWYAGFVFWKHPFWDSSFCLITDVVFLMVINTYPSEFLLKKFRLSS